MWQPNHNEKGVLFPIAIVLLFFVSSLLSLYVLTFDTQVKTYNSLELVNVRATITILGQIET